MNHLNFTVELCLPYNRAITFYEEIENVAIDLTDPSHPQRSSWVVAL